MKNGLGLALGAFLVSAGAAQAHQIWIEQAQGQPAVIRFGEFGENLRETSPGLLDNFGKPTATLISAKGEERSVDAVKSPTGFALPFAASPGETIVADDMGFRMNKFKRGDRDVTSWFHPAARFVTGVAAQQPKLTLDVVPSGQLGAFKVFFKDKPLPKAKVNIVVQSGWTKEARTDEQGQVNFDMPWQGSYLVEVGHIDPTPGERQGAGGPEKYDGMNHVTTLHVTQPEGLAPLPPGPAGTPAAPK